jgi:hypothetical protein
MRVRAALAVDVSSGTADLVTAFAVYNASGVYLGLIETLTEDTTWTVAEGFRTFEKTTSSTAIRTAYPTAAYVRAMSHTNASSTSTYQYQMISLEDTTQADGLAASLTITADTVADLSGYAAATYGFEFDINGRITGAIATATATRTDLNFKLDSLNVYDPDSDTDVPFLAATADGVKINNDMVVTNSVLLNAISESSNAYIAGEITISSTETEIIRLDKTTTGGRLLIDCNYYNVLSSVNATVGGTLEQNSVRLRLKRDGVVLLNRVVSSRLWVVTQNNNAYTWNSASCVMISYEEQLAPGNYTYTVSLVIPQTPTEKVVGRNLRIIELKR